MKTKLLKVPQAVMVGSLVLSVAIARCAPGTKDTAAKDTAPRVSSTKAMGSKKLQPADLEREAALGVKVSFEARRRLLRDLLSDLQKRSGVMLRAGHGSPAASVRVTARVKEMPLANLMNALSRLYGVVWTKDADNVYTMRASDRPELQVKMLQLGDPYWFRYRERTPTGHREREQRRNGLADEIMKHVDAGALSSLEGVPVSTLPVELQIKLRRYVEEEVASELASAQRRAVEALDQQPWSLHFAPPPGATIRVRTNKGGVTIPTSPSVSVHARDESLITYIPVSVVSSIPPSPERIEQLRRATRATEPQR